MNKKLSIGDAAKMLGVSINTLRNWDNSGKLSPVRTSGGQRRYRQEDLQVLIQKPRAVINQEPSIINNQSSIINHQSSIINTTQAHVFFNFFKSLIFPTASILASMAIVAGITYVNNPGVLDSTKRKLGWSELKSVTANASVLAAETATPDYRLLINVPAIFDKDITAPNVIYSLKAGDGIEITTGQTPTVSSNQKTFKSVKVGSTTISADSKADTIELVAGSNVTLSTSDKKVTIAAATTDLTTSGWTDSGSILKLTTAGDLVAIGAASGAAKLNLNVNDDSDLFTASKSGNLVAKLDSNGILTTTGVLPLSHNAYDLGSSTAQWNNLYVNTIHVNNGIVSWLQRNSGTVAPTNITDDFLIGGVSTASATFRVGSNGVISAGTWNANTIGAVYGGTNQSTYTTGDILYASATNTLSKLAIGSNEQILIVANGIPSWTSNPGAGGTGVFGYWQRNNGALSPANVTDDFLIGGTSTASATFRVQSGSGAVLSSGVLTLPNGNTLTGQAGNLQFSQGISVAGGTTYYINSSGNANFNTLNAAGTTLGGTTVTSLSNSGSATMSGSLTLYGTPTIATTSKQSLTLGDSNSGNVVVTNNLSAANLSGTNTGDQTITLTGDVTGSGTGSFATTIGASKVTNAMLAGSIAPSKLLTVTEGYGGTNQTTYTTGDILYSSTTNTLSKLGIGSANQVLSVVAGIPGWVASGSVGTNYWNVSAGALFPLSATADLLVGGQSTASAKFAFINVNSGTPTASVSGNIVLDAAGTITTTKKQTLTIGGGNTGNLVLGSTITSGTWNGTAISEIYGGTNQTTYTTGDLLYASGTNTLSKKAIGSTNQVLIVSGGVPTWGSVPGSSCTDCILNDPGSTQTITPTTTTATGLRVAQAASGSVDVFSVTNNGSTSKYFAIDSSGNATASGNLTFDSAVTLATTKKQSLTLGDANTGNIILTNPATTSTINSQTISSAANFTGTLTLAGVLTANSSATISGNLALFGTPTIVTTNKQSLTLGDSNTGNIAIANPAVLSSTLTLPNSNTFTGVSGYAQASAGLSVGGGTTYYINNLGTANLNAVTVNSTLGVTGATTLTGALTAQSTASVSGALTLYGTPTINTTAKQSLTLGDSNTGNIIMSGGNVGIGTTSPTSKLQVNGALTFNTGTALNSATGDIININKLVFGGYDANAATGRLFLNNNFLTLQDASAGIQFNNQANSPLVTILESGNVGIGTTGPGSKLDVAGVTTISSGYLASGLPYNTSLKIAGAGTSPDAAQIYWGDNSGWKLNFGTSSTGTFVPRVTMVDTGNVGIGTTSPLAKLDVNGTASVSGALTLYGTPTLQGTALQTLTLGGTTTGNIQLSPGSATPSLTVTTAGNIGIGTTGPTAAKLTIAGGGINLDNSQYLQWGGNLNNSINYDGTAMRFLNSGAVKLRVDASTVAIGIDGIAGSTLGVSGNAAVGASYYGTAAPANGMIVQGNVGIGTTGPSSLLEVRSATDARITINRVGAWGVSPADIKFNANDAGTDYWTLGMQPDSTNNIYLNRGTTNYVTFKDGGNVGIGTTTPLAKLDVNGTASVSGALSLYGTPTIASTAMKSFTLGDANTGNIFLSPGSATPSFVVTTAGQVGIGTTGPGQKLDIQGGNINLSSAGSTNFTINTTDATGTAPNIQINGGSTLNLFSYGTTRTGTTFGVANANAGSLTYTGSNLLFGTTGSAPVVFGTNGSERVRIDSTGNVGIGTTSPLATFDVAGSASASGNLTFRGTGTAHLLNLYDNGSLQIGNSVGGGTATPAFVVTSAGNIGIGTTGPGQKLSVVGTAWIGSTGGVFIRDNSGIGELAGLNAAQNGFYPLQFTTASWATPTMYLSTTGNVGIGTTGPNDKLEVAGAFRVTSNSPNFAVSAGGVIDYSSNDLRLVGANVAGQTAGIEFWTTAASGYAEAMRINSAGNVGIGTTSPGAKLHVNTGTNENIWFRTRTGYPEIYAVNDAVTANVPLSFFASQFYFQTGNVGIGTTAPSTLLHVSGATVATLNMTGGSGTVIQAQQSGSNTWSFLNSSGGLQIAPNPANSGIGVNIQPPALGTRTAETPTFVVSPTANAYSISGAYATQSFSKFLQPTISGTANTITNANTLYISGAPTTSASPLITNSSALRIDTTAVSANVTNAYGLYVDAPTGATNNYAAIFNTGNVGIGTTGPGAKLDVTDTSNTAASLSLTNNTATTIGNGANTLGVLDLQSTSLTTGNFLNVETNALTTGKSLNLTSTSNAYSTGNLFNTAITQAAATGTAVSGHIASISFAPTYSTAVTTPAISGNVLNLSRSSVVNTDFASTLTVSGAVLAVSDSSTQTQGTLTSTADVMQISQNYSSNTGAALNVTTAGSGFALRVNDNGTLTDTTPFVVTGAGDVGIGTTTPLAKLDVNGTASVSGALSLYGTPTIASTALQTLTLGGTTTGNIQLSPGSATPSLTVTTAGNIGIGTTAPGAKLDVNGGISISQNGGTLNFSAGPGQYYAAASNPQHIWYTAGVEKMRIDSSGNVGIGTTAPVASLNIEKSATATINQIQLTSINAASPAYRTSESSSIPLNTSVIDSFIANYSAEQWRRILDIRARGASNGSVGDSAIRFFTSPITGTNAAEVERVRIDGNGNVGIGTTGPTEKLDLAVNPSIFLEGYSNSWGYKINVTDYGGADVPLRFIKRNSGTDSEVMRITQNGNVGIGTTNPGYQLEVIGSGIALSRSSAGWSRWVQSPSAGSYSSFSTTNDTVIQAMSEDLILSANNASGAIRFGTGLTDTEKMTILSSGNVGIGTTSPGGGLDLSQSKSGDFTRFYIRNTSTTGYSGGMALMNDTNNAAERNWLLKSSVVVNGDFTIRTTNAKGTDPFDAAVTDRLYINPSGNVGIGTTAPGEKLEISGGGMKVSNGGIVFFGADQGRNLELHGNGTVPYIDLATSTTDDFHTRIQNDGNKMFQIVVGGPTGSTNAINILSGGNVGIGTTGPGAELHVTRALASGANGKALAIFDQIEAQDILTASASGTTKFTIANSGNVTIVGSGTTCVIGSGTGATNCTSDVRLKSNVTNIEASLDKILQLRPINFTWSDPNKAQDNHIGLIAQEVESLFPEVVSTVYDDYKGIDYAALVVPAIKSIQELDAKVATISAEMANLKSQFSILNNPVATMSADLWSYATESGKLTSIFDVQTANLNVVGKLQVGLMTFDDLDSSISSLTGTINIRGDLAVSGSLKVLGTSAGRAIIPASSTSITITNQLVSTSSAIFVTPEEPVNVGAKATESGKFVISIPASMSSELKVNWWIVN